MNQPKRHHFVPEVLLKRFMDSAGWVHAYSKDDPDAKIRKERPCNVFVRRHLYSTEDQAGAKDPAVEREFSQLETLIGPILDKFENAAARNDVPNLTPEERLVWHYFFALQFKRVPDFLHRPEFVADAESFFHQTLDELRRKYPDRVEEIDGFSHEASRFVKNAQIGALQSVSAEVIDVLEARGIALLRLTSPNKAFIIGSRPVVQFAFRKGRTLREPSTEMWLPISSRLLVGVGHTNAPESILSLDDHAAVRHVNVAIAEQSSHIASCSPKLTRSVAFAK